MSDPHDIIVRLKDGRRGLVEAEQARGRAKAEGGDELAAQERYQAALTLFLQAQIEWATVTLGAMPLVWERLDELAGRVEALEARAVGDADRVGRLEARANIADRVVFYDPTHPYDD